jgi:hypothetical protein
MVIAENKNVKTDIGGKNHTKILLVRHNISNAEHVNDITVNIFINVIILNVVIFNF